MRTHAKAIVSGLLAAGCFSAVLPALAAEATAYRAVVADFANGKITVIDAKTGKAVAHFGVEGPARLKASLPTGLVFASQGAQNRVDIFDSGVRVTSHGDHADVETGPIRAMPLALAGQKPSHVNIDGKRVAVFFDGDGRASVTELAKLANAKTKPAIVATAAPHHGLSAPLGDFLATSIPHPTDAKALPVGLDLTDRNGRSVAKSTDCPRMHGEARGGAVSAFGCEDGVLLLRMAKQGGAFEKLPYPASLPSGRMVRNMAGSDATASFVGDFGPDGIVIVDPAAKAFQFVALPARRMHFARDAVIGAFAYVVTEDGKVHKIDALTGRIAGSLAVTDAYSMEGGSAVARPRLSASGDRLVVTDPAKSQVHIVDTAAMTIVHKIPVAGAPFDVVLIGAAGEAH
jgi:DNA-binding beta-propeller fold protein YncE